MSVDSPLIAVLDYGIGNLRSAEKGLQRAGADARLTADKALIADAAAVVLPGVGAFDACMKSLAECGLADTAVEAAESGRPFLGICVGMQMLFEHSEEGTGATGLGILEGNVVSLPETVKRPQMQWNKLKVTKPSPVLDGLDGEWMYFVHSFAAEVSGETAAVCEYGGEVVAAVEHENIFATQFHPEKSAGAGLKLLANFVNTVTAS